MDKNPERHNCKKHIGQMLDHYFRERTCHWELEHSGTLYYKWRCSKCGFLFVEPICDSGYTDLEPNYCPKCGSRVLEDNDGLV